MQLSKLISSILVFSSCALILTGCSNVGPDEVITQDNVKSAAKSFDKNENVKITALGGNSYLIGKTVNSVKKRLESDYHSFEIKQLLENTRFNRKNNLDLFGKGKLTADEVKSDAVLSQREKQNELAELSAYANYVKNVQRESSRVLPLGSAVVAKGALTCRRFSDLEALLAAGDTPSFNKDKNRKIRRKECHILPKEIKLRIREIKKLEKGGEVYHTAHGWLSVKDVKTKPSKEELDELRKEQTLVLEQLKNHPSPAFYNGYRSLLNLSDADKTRTELANKAIAINMKEFGEDWTTASKRLVKEQQEFNASEYKCFFQKDCSENEKLNLRMAHYVLTPEESGIKYGTLPCEIRKGAKCWNAITD